MLLWAAVCPALGMRIVLQRCHSASVTVGDVEISRIGRGVVALVGLGCDDTEADSTWCCDRLVKTALWPEHFDSNDPSEEGRAW